MWENLKKMPGWLQIALALVILGLTILAILVAWEAVVVPIALALAAVFGIKTREISPTETPEQSRKARKEKRKIEKRKRELERNLKRSLEARIEAEKKKKVEDEKKIERLDDAQLLKEALQDADEILRD